LLLLSPTATLLCCNIPQTLTISSALKALVGRDNTPLTGSSKGEQDRAMQLKNTTEKAKKNPPNWGIFTRNSTIFACILIQD